MNRKISLTTLFLMLTITINACNLPGSPTEIPIDIVDAPLETAEPIQSEPELVEPAAPSGVIASGDVELLDLESFDFVSGEKRVQAGGDLYIRTASAEECGQAEIWANFPPQGGGLFLFSSMTEELSTLDPAALDLQEDDFSQFCVELIPESVYIYKRNAPPGDYVLFKVNVILPEAVSLSYIVVETDQTVANTSQPVSLPTTFTLPAGQIVDVYDIPGGESTSEFQIELTLTAIEEQDGFLLVQWDTSTGTYQAWVKKEDVAIFMSGEYSECPFSFSPVNYTPKTFPPPDGSQPIGVFTTRVLIDLSSEPVSIEQSEATLRDASDILFRLTGVVIQMVSYEIVEFTQVQDPEYYIRDSIPECYIAQKTDIPDSIIVFTYGAEDFARSRGGYSFSIEGPPGYKNHFVDPYGTENLIYLMFDHYSHKYARCGYDEEGETVISSVSIGGECRNQPGTACAMNNGYSMCETSINDLYASTTNYFSASTVIHEIMHSFGIHGNYDHYGSTECTDEMRKRDNSWAPNDEESELVNVMCPYVYDNFSAGYRP